MARSLHLTWTAKACANTTAAAGSQWFQGWKHGTPWICAKTWSWNWEKKTSKAEHVMACNPTSQRLSALSRVPKRATRLWRKPSAIWFATGILWAPVPVGALEPETSNVLMIECNPNELNMFFILYVPEICSHFKPTLIIEKLRNYVSHTGVSYFHVVLGRLASGQLASNLNTMVLLRHLALQTKLASTGTYCLDLHIVQRIPVTATNWRHVKLIETTLIRDRRYLQPIFNVCQMERIHYIAWCLRSSSGLKTFGKVWDLLSGVLKGLLQKPEDSRKRSSHCRTRK